jgi:glycine cleavage system pyridoxal-binding protein P
MAKTAKATSNTKTNQVVQISASGKVAAKGTKQGTKKISEKGSKQVKLQPAAQLRASGKACPGLPPELFEDQLPEGVGPEYYNG